ncbi:hypothetical protein LTR13_007840 [Exophiala sideris]|nr:hypothetical protein LTR13_007840 [Exophiala sideris]
MGLGVLEQNAMEHVPGTVLLDDESSHAEIVAGGLKHGTGKDKHIVLAPQPSEDPNDPLNWPAWKKELQLIILCFGQILCVGTNINTKLSKLVLVSGYNLLAAGALGPFVCAFSRKYGKRPCFIFSILICIVGTAVGEAKISHEYLLVARTIQGLATSAFESLIPAVVGDMYFVHQRGVRISIYNFILIASSNLTSIICGQVFQDMGWLWLFHLFQIFLVAAFVLTFLFCPETAYVRDSRYDTDQDQEEKLEKLAKVELHHREAVHEVNAVEQPVVARKKKTSVQELAIFTGSYSHGNVTKFILGPFLTLLNPAACYVVIVSGLFNAWYVGTAIIISGIFSGPPWAFNAAQVGYIGVGPLIGGTLASILAAVTSDRVGKYMAQFRLLLLIPTLVFCGLGMFLFGWAMATGKSAIVCSTLMGFEVAGISIGIFATLAYGLDAFRRQSNEIFIMNMLFKNFMFYGLSIFVNDWVVGSGPEEVMFVFGGTACAFCLLAIPVYIFGKRLRSWWARHDLFVLLKMTEATGPVHG